MAHGLDAQPALLQVSLLHQVHAYTACLIPPHTLHASIHRIHCKPRGPPHTLHASFHRTHCKPHGPPQGLPAALHLEGHARHFSSNVALQGPQHLLPLVFLHERHLPLIPLPCQTFVGDRGHAEQARDPRLWPAISSRP
eukprot:scaffold73567_cov23-Tisochrysis_lutea.AAC.3